VTPFILTPGNWTTWGGIFRVPDTINILNYYIGDQNCARFALELNEDDDLDPNAWYGIQCTTAPGQPGGYYSTILNTTAGSQRNQFQMQHYRSTDLTDVYHFKVAPEIYFVSSNEASTLGNRLTVLGDGFGIDPQAVSVKAGGLPCAIEYIDTNNITCQVASGSSAFAAGAANVGPQGVTVSVYNNVSPQALRQQAVKNDNSQAANLLSTQTIGTFEIIDK
jgi:hypothetical protein